MPMRVLARSNMHGCSVRGEKLQMLASIEEEPELVSVLLLQRKLYRRYVSINVDLGFGSGFPDLMKEAKMYPVMDIPSL